MVLIKKHTNEIDGQNQNKMLSWIYCFVVMLISLKRLWILLPADYLYFSWFLNILTQTVMEYHCSFTYEVNLRKVYPMELAVY